NFKTFTCHQHCPLSTVKGDAVVTTFDGSCVRMIKGGLQYESRVLKKSVKGIGSFSSVAQHKFAARRRYTQRGILAQRPVYDIDMMNSPPCHHPSCVVPEINVVPVKAIRVEGTLRCRSQPKIVVHSYRRLTIGRITNGSPPTSALT